MRPHEDGAAGAVTPTTPVTQPSTDSHEGEGHAHCRPRTAFRPVLASQVITWATVAFVIFAVLAIHDRPALSALAALAAVVLGMVGEVTR